MADSDGVVEHREGSERRENEEESLLRELCSINGVSYDKLTQEAGMKVKCLEIFFFGCHRLVGLHNFSSLRCLRIVNQKIKSMVGVGCCATLEELWICEGEIEVIEDLDHCTNMTQLYLYTNKIRQIKCLNNLTKLEKLWLNGNKITKIEGISNLTSLKDLNLADNQIKMVGDSLSHLSQLSILNLSGNPISGLQELFNIYQLSSVTSLSLCDPMYLSCPVCRLCNYSSLVLYHMPWLQILDGRDIDSKDLQELIRNLVSKKKQFYRLKIHGRRQVMEEKEVGINKKLEHHWEKTYSRLRALHYHLKALSQSRNIKNDETLLFKTDMITKRIKTLEERLLHTISEGERECDQVRNREKQIEERWIQELRSGGNVRYIQGREDMGWYKSCVELVNSRFLLSDFISHGITGIQVDMVTRIESRPTHNNFADSLRQLLECQKPLTKKSHRDLLDYLFFVWSPEINFANIENAGSGLTEEAPYVLLTNSIGLAERERLKSRDPCDRRSTDLVLCKVFVGNIVEHIGSDKPQPDKYPHNHCVYVDSPTASSFSAKDKSSLSPRLYYVFDPHLVLPEYYITVSYTTEKGGGGGGGEGENSEGDDDLISMSPQPDNRPKLSMLDSNILLTQSCEQSLDHIKELDLSCNRLTRFRFSSSLPLLSSLSLSCNELETTEDFTNMPNLQSLDISFNRLKSLEGMKSLPKLIVLDASWNLLRDQYHDISILKKYTPNIQSLDLRYNTWKKVNINYTLGMLRSLHYFNGQLVTENQTAIALREAVSTHLSLSSLLPHCRTDTSPPPSLSLSPLAPQIIKASSNRPIQLNFSSTNDWTSTVTTVDLSDLQLHKLSYIDQLPNLKWLCLQNNSLTTTEGIEKCQNLEELILDNNRLLHLPSFHHHSKLKWLSLANNEISSLQESTSSLSNLIYLNISGNSIETLNGIECFPSIQELFGSRNPIMNQRELFALKPLTHLSVADFSYSPLSSISSYRLFAIFHLSSLKSLDARPVENNEIALAKEKLGGRLTQDNVYEKFRDKDFASLKTMDFTNCSLKHVELSPVKLFDNLFSLNLEQNSLTSFSGIIHLKKLKVLCLNHNRIDCLIKQLGGTDSDSFPILPNLQVLHLAYNGISQLPPLQLHRLVSLKALFLQGNEISRVEGLNGLYNLTELVLDRNKIKQLNERSFVDLTQLRELHLEENRLSDLSHFHYAKQLERLYIGMNRIQEYSELEKLGGLFRLIELSIISNPVSRRMQHRSLLIFKLRSLQSLDGVIVTSEERHTAELTFSDRQEEDICTLEQHILPTVNNGAGQIKVTNMPFHVMNRRQTHSMETRNIHLQTLQSFQDRRRGRR